MATSHITVGLSEEGRVSSKVTSPPGGRSSIFSDEASLSSSTSSSTEGTPSPPPQPRVQRPYRMASSFELGDEQPQPVQAANEDAMQQQRRRSKPSVNPLTGDLVGCYTNSGNGNNAAEEQPAVKDVSPQPTAPPPVVIKNRIPPGGHSTPLW